MGTRDRKIKYISLMRLILMCSCIAISTSGWAEPPAKVSSVMKRSEQMVKDIQKRQSIARNKKSKASAQYQQGYQDGYNKAVLDMIQSRLISGTDGSADNSFKLPQNKPVTTQSQPATARNKDFNFWIEKSLASLNSRQWNSAIREASEAIKLNQRHSSPYINRAWAYAETGDLQQAMIDANQAILMDSGNALAYNIRAYTHDLAGQIIDAKIDYQQACELGHQRACDTSLKIAGIAAADINARVSMLISQTYDRFQDKDWKAVESISTRIIGLDPNNATAFVNRSGARTEMGDLGNALEDSNMAILLNPELGIAYNNQAYVYERMGRTSLAVDSYSRACELGVTQSCTDLNRLTQIVE